MGVFNKKELEKINELEKTIESLKEQLMEINVRHKIDLEDKLSVKDKEIEQLKNSLKEADEMNEKNIAMFTDFSKKYEVKILEAINNNKRLAKINEECKKDIEYFRKKCKTKEELDNRIDELQVVLFSKENAVKDVTNKMEILNKQLSSREEEKKTIVNDIDKLKVQYLRDREELQKKLAEEEAKGLAKIEEKLNSVEDSINNLIDSNMVENPYNYETSEEYQAKLDEIKVRQKEMVKEGNAVEFSTNWMLEDSRVKGQRFMKNLAKLVLRAFNNESDNIIMNVRYSSVAKAKEKIEKSYNAINKMVTISACTITEEYLELKLEELLLKVYWLEAKENEKEEARQREAEIREQLKLEEEIKEAKEKIQYEQTQYNSEIERLEKQLKNEQGDKRELLRQLAKLQIKIDELEEKKKDVLNREINKKAGWVYIISNDSFEGEEAYKIGTTRRLQPEVRIDELSSASVPFRYKINAVIFSEDAFALESSLHKAFDEYRWNKKNHRKEFFKVSLDKIKEEVFKYDPTVTFIDNPIDEDYEYTKQQIKEIS